ncbi:hypothetical protein I7860_20270 [Pseudomonas tolaasii]|uniref:hypothetical protein n=1 Tax=Pseudomonas tolaasii TaxID=29442 RepID=UPI001C59CB6C|nr:hypothetical protein [Pseudomonas tolaasii]MBW1249017.1 hypothetical protein [Pseudomonas tolaasii]
MTTNQTIDGVPRELLELIYNGGYCKPHVMGELRAMLDGPKCSACNDTGKMHEPGQEPGECTACFKEPAATPQGEPVAWIVTDMNGDSYFAHDRQTPSDKPLYAEQPAPVAVVLPERSPKDYAIEHAEYMAKSADNVLAKFQAYGLALLACDEGGDDGEGELFENIDSARGDLQEALVDLRGMVYEFRKRAAKSR